MTDATHSPRVLWILAAFFAAVVFSGPVSAQDINPAKIEITKPVAGTEYTVTFTVTNSNDFSLEFLANLVNRTPGCSDTDLFITQNATVAQTFNVQTSKGPGVKYVIKGTVPPGETATFTLTSIAPTTPKSYGAAIAAHVNYGVPGKDTWDMEKDLDVK